LLERALARLEQEFNERSQGSLFEACRPFMLGEQGEAAYTEAAPASGMTPAAMKMGVSRMRARYRELLRQEILQTVANPQEAEEEYRELQAVLRK
jgi:RNA polymerase sigma-70 factor (ECF subfamily)